MSEYNEGFKINDPIEVGDLSDQQSEEVLAPARRVRFVVKKATVRTQLEDNNKPEAEDNLWKVRRLAIQASIGPDGTDGSGKYAKKVMFPELPLTFNVQDFAEQYSTEYYQKRARADTRDFFVAAGYDPNSGKNPKTASLTPLPAIDVDFLAGLTNMEFYADITRREVRVHNPETNEWEGTGTFRNELKNFKPVEQAAVAA